MRLSRREFMLLSATAAAGGVVSRSAVARAFEILESTGGPRVIWLQGSGCDGCAISFLNSIHFATPDQVMLESIDLAFQSNLMAAAGDLAISAAEAAAAEPGYILLIEGAIPIGAAGRYCVLWPGMSMQDAVLALSPDASHIIALGACASFGGVTGGAPNFTEAMGVGEVLGDDDRLINLPGCPAHPDWLVGTIIYLLAEGQPPPLDDHRRPLSYFGRRVHDDCFNRRLHCGEGVFAPQLGEEGCMELLGCKGKKTYSDCPIRKWNSGAEGQSGVNWCVGARSPCLGCVEPGFPDAMSPFYVYSPTPDRPDENGGG